MSGASDPVVIVGAGQAGMTIASSLREGGFDGRVCLLGAEDCLPYERPPLSKGFLLGKVPEDALAFRPRSFFDQHDIEVRLSTTVTRLDPESQTVALSDGTQIGYGNLALALGAGPRRASIPGADLSGVVMLRTMADSLALRSVLTEARQIVIVGAGFIGLEVASVARSQGLAVTVVDVAPRALGRAVSQPISDHLVRLLEAAGAEILLGADVQRIESDGANRVAAVVLGDRVLPADAVLLSVGAKPDVSLASAAGIETDNWGIVVNDHMRTSDPKVFAGGDCVSFPMLGHQGLVRLESVQNAADQGRAVAQAILGGATSYRPIPWFWSDQGSARLQIAGLAVPEDESVCLGDPETGRFSVLRFRTDELVAVESVNRPADHMAGRRLLAAPTSLTLAEALEPSFDLRLHRPDNRLAS